MFVTSHSEQRGSVANVPRQYHGNSSPLVATSADCFAVLSGPPPRGLAIGRIHASLGSMLDLHLRLALILPLTLVACATTAPPKQSPAENVGAAPTAVTADIVDAGATANETPTGNVSASDTSAGFVHSLSAGYVPRFLPGGTAITARVGTRFGISLIVKGAPEGTIVPLRTRVTHPPISNPGTGKTTTVDEWDSPMNVGIPRYAGWAFDNRWEVVPGAWRIEILDGQRAIAGQDFTVTAEL
jgi:hypothetical protein